MKLGVCATDTLGWGSLRQRWMQCLPAHLGCEVEFFHPEEFGEMNAQRGARTAAKLSAMRRAVLAADSAGCDAIFVATNGEAVNLPPHLAHKLIIYGDAAHQQLSDLYGFKRAPWKNWMRARKLAALARAGARFACMSTWAKEGFAREYGAQGQLLRQPVDTELYTPRTSGRDPGPLRVLFVGGDFARKGGELLLTAMQGTEAELHVVSGRSDVPGAIVHGRLAPDSADLVKLYQGSDLFVLPTLADCSSNVIVEAHACGLPVIASRVGGIVDLVEHGETGLLISPGDVSGLRSAILELLSDPARRSQMGAKGRERVVAEHSYPAHTKALAQILGIAPA